MLVRQRFHLLGVEVLGAGAFVPLRPSLQRALEGALELLDHGRDVLADVLTRDAGAIREGLEHSGLNLNLGFLAERLDQRRDDVPDELAEVRGVHRLAGGCDALLQHRGFTRAEDVRQRRHRGFAHILVKVEIEQRHHRLHHGLEVR